MSYWFNCLAGFGRTVESKIALSLVQKMMKTALKLVQFFYSWGMRWCRMTRSKLRSQTGQKRSEALSRIRQTTAGL